MSDLVKAPAHYLALGVTCPGCGGAIECLREEIAMRTEDR